jgi:hypothetical protein
MKNIALTCFGKNSMLTLRSLMIFLITYLVIPSSKTNPTILSSLFPSNWLFLNQAGHYGNAITLEDVAQWAGVSVGSVVNCTNCVMIAELDAHDQFVCFPADNSENADLAHKFAESRTCPEWKGGFLAIDGSTIDLFTKPSYYGETFFDRKSKYFLGCQVFFIYSSSCAKIDLIPGSHFTP